MLPAPPVTSATLPFDSHPLEARRSLEMPSHLRVALSRQLATGRIARKHAEFDAATHGYIRALRLSDQLVATCDEIHFSGRISADGCCSVEPMSRLQFDPDVADNIDHTYASPDIAAQREYVLASLGLHPGERVLDVGSGPGYLAESMGEAVGPTGAVHGMDPSPAMNSIASARCASIPWISIDEGDATALPYPEQTFDAAVSTQVYEYVADMPRALDELRRVLRPNGRALILDTDSDSEVCTRPTGSCTGA